MTLKSLLIKLVFSTALISGAAFADGRSIELSQIDKLLPNLPKNPSSISELADSVKKASDMDLVRARLIYKWIITNIQYDYATLVSYEIGAKGVLESTSWDQLAARILREKKGVCGDMSFLYWVAAKDAGLECESILGWFSMQDGELPNDAWQRGVPNHRWNAVKIDGSWRLLDCAAQEFLDPPDQMIRTHYPLVPYWQLMDYRRPAKTPTAPPLDYPGAASSGVRFITPVNCLNFTNRGPFEFELANPSGTPLSVAVSKGWETETVPAKAENKDGKTYVTVDFTGHDEKDYYTASVFTDKEPLYCFFIVLDSALGKDPCFWVSVSPGSVAEAQGAIATSTLKIQSFNKFESATAISVSGLPRGVTATLSTNPATPVADGNLTSTLVFTSSAFAARGTTNVTVTGTSGSMDQTVTVPLTVTSNITAQFALGTGLINGDVDFYGGVRYGLGGFLVGGKVPLCYGVAARLSYFGAVDSGSKVYYNYIGIHALGTLDLAWKDVLPNSAWAAPIDCYIGFGAGTYLYGDSSGSFQPTPDLMALVGVSWTITPTLTLNEEESYCGYGFSGGIGLLIAL